MNEPELPNYFGADVAQRYDADSADMADPETLEPMLTFLESHARGGPVVEFAIGTGRVALPLAARGINVSGIELSQPMVDQLLAKPDGAAVQVVIGDMAHARVPGQFALAYLVFNTVSNLTSQDAQVDCFNNAARHLAPGGRFVIEVWVPGLRQTPPGVSTLTFALTEGRHSFDTYDFASQQMESHHYRFNADGSYQRVVVPFRYVWPAELDLMARIAGMRLIERWEDWDRRPFTADSEKHVSVWEKSEVA